MLRTPQSIPAVFFRGNPISYVEADALGFIQKKKNGEDTKASVMGITIALHASDEIYTRLVNGKIGEATAFQLASMFPDNERRQLEALDHYEAGESWTSIAWYVNSSVEDFAAADGLTQGNLFGEEESAGRRKLADYVGKVEKRIRALINVLKDAKRIQRNPSLARELNFNFSTETDVIDTRTQLEILLDAYQHPKQGEMEEVKRKAAAWDGKSKVEPSLSELIGEARLLVPFTTAEAAPVETMDDLFATTALEVPTPTGPEFFKVPAGVSEEWIKKLDDFIKFKEHPNSPKKAKYHMRVCDTPPILLNLGLKPLGIWASSYAIWHPLALDHNMSQEEMEKLPECIYDPVMVLRSSTVKHSIVLLTEMTETKEDGRIEKALVPIHVERSARHSLDIAHRVASVYGKDGLKDWLFREIEKGNLLYVNKQKTREALNLDVALQLRLSADGRVISLGELNVPDENSIVNTKNTMRDIFPDIEDSSSDITLAISTDNPDDIAAQFANARKGSLAHRMMSHARAEANRFRRVLLKPTTDNEAAQDLASVLIFMESAMRYVPTARLPRMTAQRNALEAYIKMMQQGRIGVNRNGTIRRAGLTQEQIDAVAEQAAAYEEAVARQDILPENKLTKEQAKNLQREFIRAAARNSIGTTVANIYDQIATAIADSLSDKLIDRMHKRIGQLQPFVTEGSAGCFLFICHLWMRAAAQTSHWHDRVTEFLPHAEAQGMVLLKTRLPPHWETHPLWK